MVSDWLFLLDLGWLFQAGSNNNNIVILENHLEENINAKNNDNTVPKITAIPELIKVVLGIVDIKLLFIFKKDTNEIKI